MGRYHALQYHDMASAQLVAVCDARSEVAQHYASLYHCRAYTTVDDLLANEQLDAVSLTVPTSYHYKLAIQLLESGIPLLVEKPIAQTIEQAQDIIRLATQKQVCLTVGHIERFNPAVTALKSLIDSEKMGPVISIHTRRVSPMPTQIRDANVAIDLAVHDVDIICWFLKKRPHTVTRFGHAFTLGDRDDLATIMMAFDDAVGISEVHWLSPMKERKLTLTALKGSAELDFVNQTLRWMTEGDVAWRSSSVTMANALSIQLAHFVACVQTGAKPLVSGEEGLLALQVAVGETLGTEKL